MKTAKDEMAAKPKVKFVPSTPQPAPQPATATVIESQIDGEFNGWEGETIFKLTNGQIWQQTSYEYMYHYAYMPNVIIYNASGGYKMKVEDVEDTINVMRIK